MRVLAGGMVLFTSACAAQVTSGTGGPATVLTPSATLDARPTIVTSVPTTARPTSSVARAWGATESEESDEVEDEDRESHPPLPTDADLPDTAAVTCPSGSRQVDDTASLTEALAAAVPGTVIELAGGTYEGAFTGGGAGTEESPIWLCGGRDAVIDGGSVDDGYALHLLDARHWRLVGFTVRQAQKGVMVDGGHGIVIQGLAISEIGDEAVHLRSGTTYSVVRDNEISGTGLRKEKFGEGVYVGSASSNWCTYSDCGPDRSNNNAIVQNRISATSAESIDIKEGTQDGLIQANTFDGTGGLTGADSWVDVKGNGWTIVGNTGRNSPVDGFQVHSVEKGWGTRNVFRDNTAAVNGSGYGFKLAPVQDNVLACDNRASGAEGGLSNATCG